MAYLYCQSCNSKKTTSKEVIDYKENNTKYNNKLKDLWIPDKKFPDKFYKDTEREKEEFILSIAYLVPKVLFHQ